jgi:hypothetical protein
VRNVERKEKKGERRHKLTQKEIEQGKKPEKDGNAEEAEKEEDKQKQKKDGQRNTN